HARSRRATGPFVVFDWTAVARSRVGSFLFGHEKGAFADVLEAHKGLFEQARGGTLLIEEIGDLDVNLQPKVLRAIERSEIWRGDGKPIPIDVRVIATTRRDLEGDVLVGRFRDDLFRRLAAGRIELPPLRRRRGDVALLVRDLCTELGAEE